ncbi:MAG TPA: glycosyltransferase family 2 protein [Lacunisphaera sp.]|nr:glycosyltransferase family 2 protein [Lacunisphaera sp.]
MSVPLISVVLVCRNPGPRVRDALASVRPQEPAGVEMVVIDGASTDGTREWLGSQRAWLGALVSEPDAGVYDAMNKGIAAARGEWVLFLGADDRLRDGSLTEIAPQLRQSAAGVVIGEAAYDDGRPYPFAGVDAAIRRNFIHHQAACYRRSLFATHGGFETALRIMADYEFNLRLLAAGVRFQSVPTRVALCGHGGLSDGGGWRVYREEIAVRHRYFPAWRCWLWDVAAIVRWLRKCVVRMNRSHART